MNEFVSAQSKFVTKPRDAPNGQNSLYRAIQSFDKQLHRLSEKNKSFVISKQEYHKTNHTGLPGPSTQAH